jgi:hypothetical protein
MGWRTVAFATAVRHLSAASRRSAARDHFAALSPLPATPLVALTEARLRRQWPTADPTDSKYCAPARPAKTYALVLSECLVR